MRATNTLQENATVDFSIGILAPCSGAIMIAQDLLVFEFYGPVNNEVMSSRSVNSGTVSGQA